MKIRKRKINKVDKEVLLESILASFRIEGINIEKERAEVILKNAQDRLQKSSL